MSKQYFKNSVCISVSTYSLPFQITKIIFSFCTKGIQYKARINNIDSLLFSDKSFCHFI